MNPILSGGSDFVRRACNHSIALGSRHIGSFPGVLCFFFNDTATTEIYTLSLHDALPISGRTLDAETFSERILVGPEFLCHGLIDDRSEEHTSELQSPCNLVCRLLLEKKKVFCIPAWSPNGRCC